MAEGRLPDPPLCPRCLTGRMFEAEDWYSEETWTECSLCGYIPEWAT